MANTAYFIGPQFIKDYTFIDENVDEKYLMVATKEAQEIYIREYIGSGLYNDLQTKLLADVTLSGYSDYQTLINTYIAPALKYWTMYEAAPFLKFKFTNKNIVSKTSENSTGADLRDFEKVLKWIEDKARYYSDRLIKYLQENEASFPLYINPGNGVDTIYPIGSGFDSDIYLGTGGDCLTPKQYNERNQIGL